MNLERILDMQVWLMKRKRNEEALETILTEGKVEQTKTAQKFGMTL